MESPDALSLVLGAARAHAARPAVIEEGKTWSYGELIELVQRLAHAIAAVEAEHPRVAIDVPQGAHAYAAMLATWFAGGTYCPLNVTHPAARRSRIAEMFAPHVVITGAMPSNAGGPMALAPGTVVIDLDRPIPRHTLATPAPAADLAYVLFTSGSTGDPKGVMIGRDSIAHYVARATELMLPTPEDRWSQHASIGFDFSALDIYGALGSGAALVPLASTTARADPALVIRDQRITIWTGVPSLIDVLIRGQRMTTEMLASLRLMALGGESLLEHHLRAIFNARPDMVIHHIYGPTETTVSCTQQPIDRPIPAGAPIPIGRPIPGVPMYILDEEHRQTPVGVAGEIYIGGVQVARGYLGRPDLTAQGFVPDPFTTGGRLYRSGDRARWLADGTIEFLGRADFQVKLRGYRIELGEIEAKLVQIDGVQSVVVVMREDVPGDKRLVAYYTGAHAPDASALRRSVERDLPRYMVPSAFVLMPELPLSSNGKIDRKALPPPEHSRAANDPSYVAPRSAIEAQLATIWARVLGVDAVGVEDNFFALGGHSVLAVELISLVRRELRAELSLAALFETPTIAQTATQLRTTRDDDDRKVKRLGITEGPTAILQAYYHAVREGAPEMGAPLVIPRLWRLRGPLEPSAVERAVVALGVRHDVLRTTYAKDDDTVRQIVHPAKPGWLPAWDYTELRVSEDDREPALAQAIREFLTPIDLRVGPVVRFKLIRLAPDDHALLVLIHHVVYDAAGSNLLFRELAAAYRDPVAISGELPFQFIDLATYLRSYVDSPAGQADRQYWTTRLAGVPGLELPLDFPRDEVDAERAAARAATGKQYVAHFPQAELAHPADPVLGELVVAAARRANVPLLVYFLAGLAELLHGETGQTDLVIQTALDVRPLLDAAGLIGGFNSPVMIRVDLTDRPGRDALLRQVRDALSQAYEHALVSPNELVPAHAGRVNFGFFVAGSELEIGDAVGKPIASPVMALTPFDLRPTIMLDGPRLVVLFGYNTRLFRRETVARLAERFVSVLRAMATDAPPPTR